MNRVEVILTRMKAVMDQREANLRELYSKAYWRHSRRRWRELIAEGNSLAAECRKLCNELHQTIEDN